MQINHGTKLRITHINGKPEAGLTNVEELYIVSSATGWAVININTGCLFTDMYELLVDLQNDLRKIHEEMPLHEYQTMYHIEVLDNDVEYEAVKIK